MLNRFCQFKKKLSDCVLCCADNQVFLVFVVFVQRDAIVNAYTVVHLFDNVNCDHGLEILYIAYGLR